MSRAVASVAVVCLDAGARAGRSAAPAVSSPCPGDQGDPTTSGWALSTTTFDNAYTRHAYVGNGYLSQRVPATGTGYVETTQKTGWPLFTNAYDGAFVAGLYSTRAGPADPAARRDDRRDPHVVDAEGQRPAPDTYSATTPRGQISNFRQTLFLRCGVLRTSLTWTPRAGRATDLVYDVIAARDEPARRRGAADGDPAVERAGHGHRRDRRRRRPPGHPDRRRRGRGARHRRRRLPHARPGRTGAVASTLSTAVPPKSASAPARRRTSPRARRSRSTRASGTSYEFTKFVGVDTALTSSTPEQSAISASQAAASARLGRSCFAGHASAWADLWKSDIVVAGRPELQDWIRSNLYALQSSIRAGDDNSIAPAGLSSDNYAGLIFWDAETWMYPEPARLPSRRRRVGHRVPPQDAPAARATNARELRLPGPVLPLERRRHRRPRSSATAGTRRTA